MSQEIDNFLDSIQRSHVDNAQRVYLAKTVGRNRQDSEISPLTNLVFEFFLYNSLYAVDWEASYAEGRLVHHDRDHSEASMQNALEKFCRSRCRDDNESILAAAFLPIGALTDLAGQWTHVSPDDRIDENQGASFFEKIETLGQLACSNNLPPTKSTFELLSSCRYFVYLVRNNIFHGAKSIGQVSDADQARRIGVYDLFLRCLNSLFFLSTGRKEIGAALCQLPIIQQHDGCQIDLPLQRVYQLLRKRFLKSEDSRLHWQLFRTQQDDVQTSWANRPALFYPSAGDDLFFPLVVGLPFCTDFYFYEVSSRMPRASRFRQALRELEPRLEFEAKEVADGECVQFEFDSVPRRIWTMQKDNLTFLENDVELGFFFHRGDSEGEGGSGQRWDSELLPRLLEKASPDVGLRIFTDGEPGGLDESVKSKLEQVSLPNSHRGRDYFSGVLRETTKPC